MRVETGKTILKQLNRESLQTIELEDLSQTLKECEARNLNGRNGNNMYTSLVRNLLATPIPISRRPETVDSPYRLTTPAHRHKLINLNCSRPSTPQTPTGIAIECLTPLLQFNGFPRTPLSLSLTTPMLLNTLHDLQAEAIQTESIGLYPDILQIIDNDDGSTMESLDRQLKLFSDADLNDENVIEYLLDLSQETKCWRPTVEKKEPELERKIQQIPVRRCRHTKQMSEVERRSLQRLQKEKQKFRQKTRFRKPETCGTRKSKRLRKPVKYT